jgi:diguanylate cyclase (GGDEF)-like protein
MTFRFRNLPLGKKLNAALLLCSGIAVALLFVFMLANNVHRLRREIITEITTLAEVVATNCAAAVVFNDPRSAAETLAGLRAKPQIVQAAIRVGNGPIFARYSSPEERKVSTVLGYLERHLIWDPMLTVSRPITVDKQIVGTLEIVTDISTQVSVLEGEIAALLAATLAVLLVTALAANRFRRLIITPIDKVARTAQAIAQDQDFSRRVEWTDAQAGDEIGQLIDAFNKMLWQIEDRETRLGQELHQRKQTEVKLDHLAHYDTLTHLPNRFLFQETLALTLQRAGNLGERVGLLFIDLDHFKVVNDSLGHATGDVLLVLVAERLKSALRGSDVVSRLGGDEFTVIIDNVAGHAHLRHIADKLTVAISQPIELKDVTLSAPASIGIALYPDDASDAETLLRNADTAMYFAKSHGRGNYQFFSAEMNERANKRLMLESHLREAVGKGELSVVYQPQIDFASGRMIGCEALLRWSNPELGSVSPTDFIPIAEESGLIHVIGDFVLKTACQQAKSWLDETGVALRTAVNISIRQFNDQHFIGNVQRTLAAASIPASLLELEITESCIMDNIEDTLKQVRRLRGIGIRLSIDDFGTGYSSMAYLKQLPATLVKIDQSFVRNLPASLADIEIVRAVLHLAQGLHMETLAEGVETAAQARFLADEGCTTAQGYYFSRPVSAEAITDLLRSQNIFTWNVDKHAAADTLNLTGAALGGFARPG